jgi:ATP-binding cassette subfamily B protein
VESEAFARARRFLHYSPLAKWSALVAAIGTAVLYVALLLVLGLFIDLAVNRGEIPTFQSLAPGEQRQLLERWSALPPESRLGLLRPLSPADERRQRLAQTDPARLSPHDIELLWRGYVAQLLQERVGPDAAERISQTPPDQPVTDSGILGLVVTSAPRVYGGLISRFARLSPWTWRSRDASWPNFYYYLFGLFWFAAGLALLRALLHFGMIALATRATADAATRLRRAVYHQAYRLGTLAVRALGPSEAVGIFTRELESVHRGLFAWLTTVFREPVKFVLLLALALAVSFWLGLAFLLFAVVVWLVGGQIAAHYRRQGRFATQRGAEQLGHLQESLMLMRLVKVYLMEQFNQARVERQLARYARAQVQRNLSEAIYGPLLVFLGTMAAAIVLCAAGLLLVHRQLAVAQLIMLAVILASIYGPTLAWLDNRRILRRARSSAVALFRFLDRKGEVGQVVGAEFLPPLSRQLEFDEVSLREPGTDHLLLHGVSLTIQAGQRIGLVGTNELEKHALVYLLPRFLDPTSGEIRFDDHNLRWVTLDSLRAQIAIVLQHNLVFNDTVANNIGCGDPSYTLPQLIEAAKIAHAHQFIQKLPHGYETVIGELGHTLDLGTQFLIALARAILRDPALLIVEEPTTPLDENTKALLDDTFARVLPGRTVIFLPHRATTIRSCDRILLLHNGRIQATGTHRELLANNELYRHLHYLEFHEPVVEQQV